jgi:hypothetical protein
VGGIREPVVEADPEALVEVREAALVPDPDATRANVVEETRTDLVQPQPLRHRQHLTAETNRRLVVVRQHPEPRALGEDTHLRRRRGRVGDERDGPSKVCVGHVALPPLPERDGQERLAVRGSVDVSLREKAGNRLLDGAEI